MRAILFDLDGVLVHSQGAWFRLGNQAASDLGGHPVDWPIFCKTFGQGSEADVSLLGLSCTAEELDEYYARTFSRFREHVRVEPDAREVLLRLRAMSLELAVVTNTVSRLALEIVAGAGLEDLFEHLLGADQVKSAKPAPDLLHLALERLGVGASEAVMVGDSVYDEQAASGAKVRFVGFRRDGDRRVESLSELPVLVMGEQAGSLVRPS